MLQLVYFRKFKPSILNFYIRKTIFRTLYKLSLSISADGLRAMHFLMAAVMVKRLDYRGIPALLFFGLGSPIRQTCFPLHVVDNLPRSIFLFVWPPNITWWLTWLYMVNDGWVKDLDIVGADIGGGLKSHLGKSGLESWSAFPYTSWPN